MSTRHWRLVLVLLGLVGRARTATAQGGSAFVSRGIGSYRALEFDSAAGWLRRALTPPLLDGLPPDDQVQALAYLGATEHFRGHNDSAAAVFRRMLRLDPRARTDPLIFPPEVTSLFEEVRGDFPIVALASAPEAILDAEHPTYPVTLWPSIPHGVAVVVERADGRVVDTLYAGPIGDSLLVAWNGRDGAGARLDDGGYWLTAISVAEGPRSCRVRLPVRLASRSMDTLPLPPPLSATSLLPERAGNGEGPSAFARAALLAAGALALPAVANDAAPGNTRIMAGTLTVAGVVALIRFRPGAAIPENVAANATARARWQERHDQVAVENAARRRGDIVQLRAQPLLVIGCGRP